ncbi:MAG: hypothetical protein SFT68_01820 [Rickettsiaceae bacterium]|nr:hypothetical protein [Rickettsiaceae bacterium]
MSIKKLDLLPIGGTEDLIETANKEMKKLTKLDRTDPVYLHQLKITQKAISELEKQLENLLERSEVTQESLQGAVNTLLPGVTPESLKVQLDIVSEVAAKIESTAISKAAAKHNCSEQEIVIYNQKLIETANKAMEELTKQRDRANQEYFSKLVLTAQAICQLEEHFRTEFFAPASSTQAQETSSNATPPRIAAPPPPPRIAAPPPPPPPPPPAAQTSGDDRRNCMKLSGDALKELRDALEEGKRNTGYNLTSNRNSKGSRNSAKWVR